MSSIDAQALATTFAGIGLFLLAGSTWLQYRESRKSRSLIEYQINADLSDRILKLVPELTGVLSLPEDSIDREERGALVDLFLIYAQARKADRLGLYRDPAWDGLRDELAFWANQPKAVAALAEFRRSGEGWPPGFFEFVDSELDAFRSRKAARTPVSEADGGNPATA
ncbi:hypothetical protein [Plantactinospora soyae]|uniref:Uncharacterized protein n=1 Tax=Plantactinospora soyae TaxID=1544732 RepID=A0A927LZZ3_9ACTN|nr:hypothetical protein [Plantactinospora soyae]MBE1485499.1 hypothetical protein [Plantactinospora soyae]